VCGERVGAVEDLVLALDGTIETVVVATEDGSRELLVTSDVSLGRPARDVRAAS
jgi:hypothetical protein